MNETVSIPSLGAPRQHLPPWERRKVAVSFVIFTLIWGSTWSVIRDQLHDVPPAWSVSYRFILAAIAMAILAKANKRPLLLDRQGMAAALSIGFTQFCINFNAIYLAEQYITSGVVATMFALLLLPNAFLGWLLLGHKPGRNFAIGSAIAVTGIVLLSANELQRNPAPDRDILAGIGFTVLALIGASWASVYQARERVRRHHLKPLLAWSMAFGALFDIALAWVVAGPPVLSTRPTYWAGVLYLGVFASALAFNLYFPVVRKIGPGKAAYSSALVPIIAMAFSTILEGFRWTPLAIAGAVLTIAGMLFAMSRRRLVVQSPDAA